jgi:hypothetical protein
MFQPTIADETHVQEVSKVSYQSISASPHPQYRLFSFEELRVEDYIQMGRFQPTQNSAMKTELVEESPLPTNTVLLEEWKEVESGYYEYILEDDPAPKPRVVLPVITKGIISIAMVHKLQDSLGMIESELKYLKESAASDRAKHSKQLETKLEAQMEETLKTRSEKV